MRILIWHVHAAWTTAFVAGGHDYVVPVLPDRGPFGRGRARTYAWPETVIEATPGELAGIDVDAVVLQRPEEEELARQWLGLVRNLQEAGLSVVGGEQVGVFVWCRLPEGVDEEVLVRDAAENGIQLAPGRVFHLNPSPPHLRFSTPMANDARLFAYLGTRLPLLQQQLSLGVLLSLP